MKCPSCKKEIPNGSKFCMHCGAKITVANTCPKCGATNLPADSKFCPDCGTRLNFQNNVSTGDLIEFNVGGVTFKMVRVDAGTFTMGATAEMGNSANDEKPIHQVTLTNSYYIGQTLVTQALWEIVMGNNPSEFKGRNRPVEKVSWDDCQKFCHRLYELTGKRFRLPTEAEWEFAARGGNKSKHYQYSGSNNPGDVAWHDENSGGQTHDVATKQPNELGIYDMSGNVWEWCADFYGGYSSSSQTNPTGPNSGSHRVTRGGSWYYNASCCRVSCRDFWAPVNWRNRLGLRLVLSE